MRYCAREGRLELEEKVFQNQCLDKRMRESPWEDGLALGRGVGEEGKNVFMGKSFQLVFQRSWFCSVQ